MSMFPHIQKLFSQRRLQVLAQRSGPIFSQTPLQTRREDTKHIRDDKSWKAGPTPAPLNRRWVELTGPGNDPKMVINAMNCQANGYMLDLEDSMSPTPSNVIQAHENIRQLVRGTLRVVAPHKTYEVVESPKPTFMVRVRGMHMPHEGIMYDACEFLEHNAHRLHDEGKGPFLYVPKLETYEEATFVNDLLSECEEFLKLPNGTIKVTVLIETFPAIFQTEEIVYALRSRITALNCGRWDYLFSMIKSMPEHKFPDRGTLGMKQPYMEAYVRQIVQTCHSRDIHAMGGMSAFIPSKDPEEDAKVRQTVYDDKTLEISHGCDGAWVAHPGMIDSVQGLFNEKLNGQDHQKGFSSQPLDVVQDSSNFYPKDDPNGQFTDQCFRRNVDIAAQYTGHWLAGSGAVGLNGLMEDLATAEISVLQTRNWLKHGIVSADDVRKNLATATTDDRVKDILDKYIFGDANFLPEVAGDALDEQSND